MKSDYNLKFAAVKVEGKNIQEAASILDKFQAGTLEPVEDLFGDIVSPEEQAEKAKKDLAEAYARLQAAISKI